MRAWRVANGRLIKEFVGHTDTVTGVAFGPGGRLLVTSSEDKDARLWDVEKRRASTPAIFHGHSALVSGVAVSTDGRWVATAGPLKAGIWEVGSSDLPSNLLFFLTGNEAPVSSVAFSRSALDGLDGRPRRLRSLLHVLPLRRAARTRAAREGQVEPLQDPTEAVRRLARPGEPRGLPCLGGHRLQDPRRVPPDRRPAEGDRRAHREHQARRPVPDHARRHRHGQDGDHGLDDRAAPAAGARHRAQQDPGRAALQRVPRVLPAERGRVLRLVLRLLPAGGVRPAGRPLHREGLVAERRHRAAAAERDLVALHAPRRDRRRLGLVHLRPRLAGGVARARPDPRRGRGARPRPRPAQADRQPVLAERFGPRPWTLPREG